MNPYESPAAAETQSTPAVPHGTSILKEAWRGAKFGAKLTACSLGVIVAIGCMVAVGFAIVRWSSAGVSPIEQAGGPIELLMTMGGGIFAVALMSTYAAIAGAIIMGLLAFVRRARAPVDD